MAELQHLWKRLHQTAASILSRLQGKQAPLSESRSSPSNDEPVRPAHVDLPPLPSLEAVPASADAAPNTPVLASPSETMPLAPVSGAAFEAATMLPPAVAKPDVDSSTRFSRKPERAKSRSPSLVVYALGRFRVYCDDQLVTTWRSKKGKAIFKYLIAQREHQAGKDILMDIFWPDAGPASARNNLNVAIHGLRQALKAVQPDNCYVLYEDVHYVINPEVRLWFDFEEFSRRYERALALEGEGNINGAQKEYEQTVNLYHGDFLQDDLYEDWTMLTRERLRSTYMDMLDHLSRIHFNRQQYLACVRICELILSRDNCREDAHRLLMRCYNRQQQTSLALRQYQACVEALRHELDIAPTAATTLLYEQIRRGQTV